MAIPFKRMGRKDPRKVDGVVKYHPQLVTQGQSVDLDKLAYTMKEKSSLSLGDIQSVLTNLVEAMRTALFDGKSVNIHAQLFVRKHGLIVIFTRSSAKNGCNLA